MECENFVFDKKTKFLVTGGAGFIGSNICEAILKMGYKVVCLDNFSTGREENIKDFCNNQNFKLIRGDIRNLEVCDVACNGADYVFHEAAWGSVQKSIELPLLYDEINIKGTLNIMEASRKNKVKRFIYASSSAIYGDCENIPAIEGVEGNVLSPYALTKKVNEGYAKLYSKLYSLETVGLRYFNVFGKRQDSSSNYAAVIPKFIKSLMKNKTPIIYGDGTQSRDFTYVENVVDANLKACLGEKKISGEVFNIGCGNQITLNELYSEIAKLLKSTIKPQYSEKRVGDIKYSNASIEKAKLMLNYKPKYNFYDGIKFTVDWYKAQEN